VDLWPIRLRERLPVIFIPLAAPDPDVLLGLQEVLNRVYDVADYSKYICTQTPQLPLTTDDASLARALVPASVSTVA